MMVVLLVLGFCVPVLITLIELEFSDRRTKRLEVRLDTLEAENHELRLEVGEWMGIPRKLLESDLPEEEVKRQNG